MAVHNLPRQSTVFVSRKEEIADVTHMLADLTCRLVTLAGPGGVGKSRLSLAIAEQLDKQYEDGIFFVELAPVQSHENVISAIAAALNVQPMAVPELTALEIGVSAPAEQTMSDYLLDYLRHKHILLILDNFEHVLPAATLVDQMLEIASDLNVLITSRAVLHLDWEWVYDLHGLAIPLNDKVANLEQYGAIELFTERARRAKRHFSLDDDPASVVRICRLLDGLPLGIEMATSWLRGYSCAELADELEGDLSVLATRQRTADKRHFSLRVVFDHSWRLLSPAQQTLLTQLAVFQGTFRFESAQAVGDASRIDLMDLVDKSLLRVDPDGRYALHALIREFALEHLVSDPDAETNSRLRHAQHYANLLSERHTDLKGVKMSEAIDKISAAIDNIRTAWDWANQRHDRDLVLQMGHPLFTYHLVSDRVGDEAVAWFESALAMWEEVRGDNLPLYGQLLTFKGGLREEHQVDAAIPTLREAVDILQSQGDEEILALVQLHLNLYLMNDSQWGEAQRLLPDVLARYEALDDEFGAAQAHYFFGMWARQISFEMSQEHLERALEVAKNVGNPWLLMWTSYQLGHTHFEQGNSTEAEFHLREALSQAQSYDSLRGVALGLAALGRFYVKRSQFSKAQTVLEEALAVVRESGWSWGQAWALEYLGRAAHGLGNWQEANRLGQQAIDIFRDLGDAGSISWMINNNGFRALLAGNYGKAKRHFTEAVEISSGAIHRAACLVNLGHACAGLGETLESRRYYLQSVVLGRQQQHIPLLLEVVAGLARHVALYGELEYAVTLLSLAIYHSASTSDVKFVAGPLLAEIEAELSPEAFAAAVEQGKTFDLDAVLDDLLVHPGIVIPGEEISVEQPLVDPLTERELEVLALLVDGLSNRQIAEKLYISVGTAKTHVHHITDKLAVENRTQAALKAKELGLV